MVVSYVAFNSIRRIAVESKIAPAKPQFREDGIVEVPAFELPPSELSSPAAQAAQAMRAKMQRGAHCPKSLSKLETPNE
jgi:hypothetical protein